MDTDKLARSKRFSVKALTTYRSAELTAKPLIIYTDLVTRIQELSA